MPGDRFVFLSTPYTGRDHHDAERDAAFLAATLAAAHVPMFAPIILGHRLVCQGMVPLAHLSHADWMALFLPVLHRSSLLVSAHIPGAEGSVGMAMERQAAEAQGIPVADWREPFDRVPGAVLQHFGRGE